jgi:hypothetical protein
MEDVRLGLEKLPDRFVEHKNTVFVVSNLHYSEAASLKSKNESKQKNINWKVVKLSGKTSIDFSSQLRKLNEFLEKNWNIERDTKSGNPVYREPSVLVIYRKDQEFILNDIIPTKKNSENKFDLIVASQPYRSRITAEKKVKYVIEPMLNALAPNGKLLTVHACGKDPANQIIQKLWPEENPFPSLSKDIIKYIKSNLDEHLLKQLSFKKQQQIRCNLRALPNEIKGGISTSIIFSAWNAAVYVNQIDENKILRAQKSSHYENIVSEIINKYKGLYFNNELFVIERK